MFWNTSGDCLLFIGLIQFVSSQQAEKNSWADHRPKNSSFLFSRKILENLIKILMYESQPLF